MGGTKHNVEPKVPYEAFSSVLLQKTTCTKKGAFPKGILQKAFFGTMLALKKAVKG